MATASNTLEDKRRFITEVDDEYSRVQFPDPNQPDPEPKGRQPARKPKADVEDAEFTVEDANPPRTADEVHEAHFKRLEELSTLAGTFGPAQFAEFYLQVKMTASRKVAVEAFRAAHGFLAVPPENDSECRVAFETLGHRLTVTGGKYTIRRGKNKVCDRVTLETMQKHLRALVAEHYAEVA